MAKKVIKEIIIILLLCLAIILVLGVLLYEYVPINKIIPEAVSYTTPEDISEEINKEVDPIPIMTYSTNSTDLKELTHMCQESQIHFQIIVRHLDKIQQIVHQEVHQQVVHLMEIQQVEMEQHQIQQHQVAHIYQIKVQNKVINVMFFFKT